MCLFSPRERSTAPRWSGVGVTEVASPAGVIFGLIPMTNPVFKALVDLKGRNALIFSCHRSASWVGNRMGEIIGSVLRGHGAPADLLQWIRQRTSRKKLEMFMRHRGVSLILATGGVSIVKAAYGSGTYRRFDGLAAADVV